jgi:hypothetical protein
VYKYAFQLAKNLSIQFNVIDKTSIPLDQMSK